MDVLGITGISRVSGVKHVAPVNSMDNISKVNPAQSVSNNNLPIKITGGNLKSEPIEVNLNVRSVDEVRALEAEELLAVAQTQRSHAIFAKATARLAQKYNDNNGYLYDSTGGKHLFDAVGQEIDVRL